MYRIVFHAPANQPTWEASYTLVLLFRVLIFRRRRRHLGFLDRSNRKSHTENSAASCWSRWRKRERMRNTPDAKR